MEIHQQLAKPSKIVVEAALLLQKKGIVLDLACGGGRNGRHLLAAGYDVFFLDRDTDGLCDLKDDLNAEIICADLENGSPWPLENKKFDMLIVSNYLWRPIMGKIFDSVKVGGILVYETFALGNETYGKPSNPDFLLKEGELRDYAKDNFNISHYSHGIVKKPTLAIKQKLIAIKRP